MKIHQAIGKWLKRVKDQPAICFTILVVSDDRHYLPYLCGIFEDRGYQVYFSTNAAETIPMLETMDLPDVMIFDFVTPDRDARDLLERARIRFGKSNTPPVIFMRDTPEDEAAAHDLDANDVILKPIEPQLLLERVSSLVKQSRLGKAEQ